MNYGEEGSKEERDNRDLIYWYLKQLVPSNSDIDEVQKLEHSSFFRCCSLLCKHMIYCTIILRLLVNKMKVGFLLFPENLCLCLRESWKSLANNKLYLRNKFPDAFCNSYSFFAFRESITKSLSNKLVKVWQHCLACVRMEIIFDSCAI